MLNPLMSLLGLLGLMRFGWLLRFVTVLFLKSWISFQLSGAILCMSLRALRAT